MTPERTDYTNMAATLTLAGALAGGCQENDLRPLPETPDPWTESCFGANNGFLPPEVEDDPDTSIDESLEGRVVNGWADESLRHAMYRIVHETGVEEVLNDEAQAQECLLTQAAWLAMQGRCSGNPDMPAVTGASVSNPYFGLTATSDIARDDFGNPAGYSSGEDCHTDAVLPLTIETNFTSGNVRLTLSLDSGAGEIAENGNLISLPDDGSISYAGDFPQGPDSQYNYPWFGVNQVLINADGERLEGVAGVCVTPGPGTEEILGEFEDEDGCVVPPAEEH